MDRGEQGATRRRATLAREVVDLGVAALFVDMPFLDTALFRLAFRPAPAGVLRTWACDGAEVLYDEKHVLKRYRTSPGALSHDILHVVLHCIFTHMFVEPHVQQRFWNLACDIAAESLIDSLALRSVDDGKAAQRGAYLAALVDLPATLTAERVYRCLLDADLTEEDLLVLEDAFFVDDHPWYWGGANEQADDGKSSSGSDDDLEQERKPGGGHDRHVDQQLSEQWRQAASSVQTGLETLFNRLGQDAGKTSGLLQALRELNRKRYDYRAFLQSLCSWDEHMRINDDEFDYVYYTYGLDMYGDMPLIEPLEYKDVKVLRDVAVVVDTSGSVAGEMLQRLLERTYELIDANSSATRRFRIRLIQCDDEVREDVLLTSRADLDAHLQDMSFKGLGATDFTAAFAHVDALLRAGELVNFKGVVYFTDGRGRYPERKPPYRCAFVFLEDDYDAADVPPWAIKLVLSDEEVRKL